MPKLRLFAAAEKAIVDNGTNSLSVIGFLENVGAQRDFGDDVVIVFPWSMVSIWEREAEDVDGQEYEQRFEFLAPSGAPFMDTLTTFTFTKPRQRQVVAVNGFPAKEEGQHYAQLSIRKAGSENWTVAATYPIGLKRTPDDKTE